MKQSNDKISIKEIHETFWRCRDFELSHLWQRSIFLTAFLILCYTGYGSIVITMVCNNSSFEILNLIACLISVLGIIFSSLWVMMGKGSKAWYERYEKAIEAFESNDKFIEDSIQSIGGFGYKNLPDYNETSLINSLLNGSGGAYSPSRINIAIGQISLYVWFAILLCHSIIALFGISWISINCAKWIITIFCIVIVSSFFIAVFHYNWLHSNTLENKVRKDSHKTINK